MAEYPIRLPRFCPECGDRDISYLFRRMCLKLKKDSVIVR